MSPSLETRHEGRFGWVVVLSSFILHFLADGISYAFGIFTPQLLDHYKSSRQTIGWLNSVRISISFLAGPLAGKLSDQFGYRFVTMLGVLLASLGLGAPFFYSQFYFVFFSSSVIGGIGFGLIFLPSICIIGNYFERRRALAIGIAVCGTGVGTFSFAPLVSIAINKYSWRGAILINSAILLNCCVCAAFFRPVSKLSKRNSLHFSVNCETRSILSTNNTNQSALEVGLKDQKTYISKFPPDYVILFKPTCLNNQNSILQTTSQTNRYRKSFSKILTEFFSLYLLKSPKFIIFAISNFLTSVGFIAPFLFAVDRALLLQIEEKNANFLISSIGLGNTFGRIMFGLLATFGSSLLHVNIYVISLSLCGIITASSCWASTYPLMLAYTTGFGLFSGSFVTLTPVVLADIFGDDSINDTFGLILVCNGIATLIGPPLTGAIFDYTKSYDTSFVVCGGSIFISGIVVYTMFCIRSENPVQH